MNPKIVIKKTEDANLLAQLNRDVQSLHHEIEPDIFKPFVHENMAKLFQMALKSDHTMAYIAEVDGVAAGYMMLAKSIVEENGFKFSYTVLHIDQICVESEYKGNGIGKALVNFAKHYAKENQISRIEMNFWTKNSNSGEFFRSQGFENYNERLFTIV